MLSISDFRSSIHLLPFSCRSRSLEMALTFSVLLVRLSLRLITFSRYLTLSLRLSIFSNSDLALSSWDDIWFKVSFFSVINFSIFSFAFLFVLSVLFVLSRSEMFDLNRLSHLRKSLISFSLAEISSDLFLSCDMVSSLVLSSEKFSLISSIVVISAPIVSICPIILACSSLIACSSDISLSMFS